MYIHTVYQSTEVYIEFSMGVHQIECKYQLLFSFSFLGLVDLQTGLERYVLLLSQPLVRVSPLSRVARGREGREGGEGGEGGGGRREGGREGGSV